MKKKIPEGSLFVFADGTEIELEDEDDFTLEDIIEKMDNIFILQLKNKNITPEENKALIFKVADSFDWMLQFGAGPENEVALEFL